MDLENVVFPNSDKTEQFESDMVKILFFWIYLPSINFLVLRVCRIEGRCKSPIKHC